MQEVTLLEYTMHHNTWKVFKWTCTEDLHTWQQVYITFHLTWHGLILLYINATQEMYSCTDLCFQYTIQETYEWLINIIPINKNHKHTHIEVQNCTKICTKLYTYIAEWYIHSLLYNYFYIFHWVSRIIMAFQSCLW